MDLLNVVIRADTSGADRSTAALDKMTAGARQADAAIASLGNRSAHGMGKVAQAADLAAAANRRLAASAQGASHMTANLAAQFQDIAVTAAMGMSPLQIALQQGTQISAAFGDKGAAGALQALGGAFLSVISPISLVTIGLVALAAVGLQMVDWTALAKASLQALAGGLEVIAPYAAVAATGLALFYSPAIITGMVSVIALLGRIAAQAVITGAALVAANPVGALVLGFVAAVTAVGIFRDEIAKVLGRDIVADVQNAVNYIIGAFVGAFNGIKATWGLLPAAIGDLVIQAVNNTIGGVESMISFITGKINDFIKSVNGAIAVIPENLRGGWDGIGEIGPVGFGRAPNPYAGAADKVAGEIGTAMQDAQQINYVGAAIGFVQDAASGAAGALRDLAAGMGSSTEESKNAAKEAERQAEAYADLTRAARQFIEAEQLKAKSLGMSEEAASRAKFTQDLLNKAANDNIELSAAQRQEIDLLGAAMAAAEDATRNITEIYELGKGVFNGFFSDMKSGLKEGQSFWEALGNAGANALDKIADRALSMAANGIFDMIFGSIMGGLTGGMGGGQWGVAGGFTGFPGIFGIPGMAEGGTVGRAGLSWVGEKGPELLRLPQGAQVIPNGPSMTMAANQNGGDIVINNVINVPAGAGADVAPAIAREVTKELRRQLPDALDRHSRNPLRRVS